MWPAVRSEPGSVRPSDIRQCRDPRPRRVGASVLTVRRMAKKRTRRGEPVPHDAVLVVRGDLLDPEQLRIDAVENYEVYGFFGLSVLTTVGGIDLAWITARKLARTELLVVFPAGGPPPSRA